MQDFTRRSKASMEEKVVEMTKTAIARGDSAMLWAVDVISFLRHHHPHYPDPPFPSIALGHALVACAFDFPDHTRTLWTYLDHAMACKLVSSLHVLALLTSRVLPKRHLYPEKYSMFLELTGTHIFCLGCMEAMPFCDMPDEWSGLTQKLEMLEVHVGNISSKVPIEIKEALRQLLESVNQDVYHEWKLGKSPVVQVLVGTCSRSWSFGNNYNVGRAAAWLSIDIFMENMIDGIRVPATSVITTLAELVKSLQAALKASWHDAFLALWMSALRLVQREQGHMEGPKPQSGSRCCMLLSIVPLASVLLIEEEEKRLINMVTPSSADGASGDKDKKAIGKRRAAFLSSLEVLGQFEGLLSPHHHVAKAAYPAATQVVGGFSGGTRVIEGIGTKEGNASVRTGCKKIRKPPLLWCCLQLKSRQHVYSFEHDLLSRPYKCKQVF